MQKNFGIVIGVGIVIAIIIAVVVVTTYQEPETVEKPETVENPEIQEKLDEIERKKLETAPGFIPAPREWQTSGPFENAVRFHVVPASDHDATIQLDPVDLLDSESTTYIASSYLGIRSPLSRRRYQSLPP